MRCVKVAILRVRGFESLPLLIFFNLLKFHSFFGVECDERLALGMVELSSKTMLEKNQKKKKIERNEREDGTDWKEQCEFRSSWTVILQMTFSLSVTWVQINWNISFDREAVKQRKISHGKRKAKDGDWKEIRSHDVLLHAVDFIPYIQWQMVSPLKIACKKKLSTEKQFLLLKLLLIVVWYRRSSHNEGANWNSMILTTSLRMNKNKILCQSTSFSKLLFIAMFHHHEINNRFRTTHLIKLLMCAIAKWKFLWLPTPAHCNSLALL